jgi:hypothetical protein
MLFDKIKDVTCTIHHAILKIYVHARCEIQFMQASCIKRIHNDRRASFLQINNCKLPDSQQKQFERLNSTHWQIKNNGVEASAWLLEIRFSFWKRWPWLTRISPSGSTRQSPPLPVAFDWS